MDERRKLGQYFTCANVVDLILGFCLRDKDDLLLDPSCGLGVFLERALRHKRVMDARLPREEILATLWGVDVDESVVCAAAINLAGGDLGDTHVIHGDFFDQRPGADGCALPQHFDCIVGNPPYTRQEWMGGPNGDDGYKRRLIERATTDRDGQRIARISKRAGIQVYFFIHGTGFLRDGGRFGFVVSNSWLDVDYGKGLQEFLLENYKIVAIIESKVERWFADADINTCIVILEKCADQKARDANVVRFVQLRRDLDDFVADADEGSQEDVARLRQVDVLIRQIMTERVRCSDDRMQVHPIVQRELWEKGYDAEAGRYAGTKWGQYLRAPDIYFDILEGKKDKLVHLSEVADVRFGIKTGANAFFYLDEETIARWGIEPEYLKPVVKSPRECKAILVQPEDVTFRVLLVHRDKEQLAGTNVLKYIQFGESQGYHRRRTCASRARWYDLGQREPGCILWGMIHYQRHLAPFNARSFQVDHNLFEILPRSARSTPKVLCALLNSTFANLMRELVGRTTLGQGALKTEGIDIAGMWLPDPRKLSARQAQALESAFDALASRPVGPIFEELEKADRMALDSVVFDVLDLSPKMREAVYQAVVDLVRARIERAQSVVGSR